MSEVREVNDGASLYPHALEHGERSERALKLAAAFGGLFLASLNVYAKLF